MVNTTRIDLSDTVYGDVKVDLSMTLNGVVRGGTVISDVEPVGIFGVTATGITVCSFDAPVGEGYLLVDAIREALHRHAANG